MGTLSNFILSEFHSESGPMKKDSGKPSGYRKRSATKNVSSTTGKKTKWYRGKSIVSDGPSPPSVQPPEEEEFFPTPFPHIPVRGRLAHFLNQWQLITSDKWVLSVLSVTKDPDRNLMLQEEVHTLLQKGAVELVNPPLTPGFYSRLTCDRPLRPESASNSATFQDGDQQIYLGFNSFRYVDNVSI